MKYRDEGGREYVLIDDALVDIMLYFSIALAIVIAALNALLAKLP